jgi:hypothetical protein
MMRGFVALAAVAAVAATASAQFTGYGVGGQYLLLNQSVQRELKITPQQAETLKGEVNKILAPYKAQLDRVRDTSPDEYYKLVDEITQKTNAVVVKVLDAEQVKRLREIDLQQRGPMALQDPEVRKALKIDKDQEAKLKTLADETFGTIRRLDPARDGAKIEDTVKKALQQLDTILTDAQKRSWQEMLGKPFEVVRDRS